ncbi:MAG TPA: TPM domain-containing protein [Candidatus Eisenbacteria bacterium]|nr:TPM domain-containing protein [Candidatus Eisenbacteria bacterium]
MTSVSTSSSRTIARPDAGPRRAAPQLAVFGSALLLAAISVLVPCTASARDWPVPTGYVNDYAKIIDAASADSIETLAKELQEKTGAELAVVTLPDLGGEEIEPAATELFSRWGVGGQKKDDGVLVLLALKERRVRIETGYGIEGIIPDGRAGGIIRSVMGPDLSADRFGIGLLKGARAVAAAIAAEHGVTLTGTAGMEPPSSDGNDGIGVPGIFLLLFILLVFIVVSSIFNAATRGRRGWSGRRGGWYGPGGFGGMGGLGGFGGGFGGGGGLGGGGGFGGFGGGSSGGGGASGRF